MLSDSSIVFSGPEKLASLQLVESTVSGVVLPEQLLLAHCANVTLIIGSALLTSTNGMAWAFW